MGEDKVMELLMSPSKMEYETRREDSSSEATLQQERDLYKEKFFHLKIVLREMQQTLQSQKIRKEGVETISVLLKESRLQIATLENQKRALETAVRNLQNRLANHGLSNSVTCEENELFIPGTSKQILDNLAKENARLRKLVGMSGSLEDMSKLHETIQHMESMNSVLQIERDNLLQKVKDLETILASSDNQKDQDIGHLREHIEKLRSSSRTQDVLCQSMGGEVTGLRHRLKDFVLQCQQLEMRLEEVETSKTTAEQEVQTVQANLPRLQEISQDTPDGNILSEENSKLKDEIQKLKDGNKRWQEYNRDRERYTQDLTSKLVELQQRYKQDMEMRITEERERQLNNLLVTAKEKLEKITESKKVVEEKLASADLTIKAKTAEVQQLRNNQSGVDEATISALKAQIQLCTEDFETERQDRVKAQDKLYQLSDDILTLKRENQQLQYRLQASAHGRQFQRAPQSFSPQGQHEIPQLQSRGWEPRAGTVEVDGSNVVETDCVLKCEDHSPKITNDLSLCVGRNSSPTSFDNIQAGPVSMPMMRSDLRFTSSRFGPAEFSPAGFKLAAKKKVEDTLCCPKCSQGFSEEEQDKLLDHMEICCE